MMNDLDYWKMRLNKFMDSKEINTISAIAKFDSLSGIGKVRYISVVSELVQPMLNQYNVDPRYFKLLLNKKMTSKKFTYQRVAIWAEYFHEEGVTPSIGNFDAIVPSYAKFE